MKSRRIRKKSKDDFFFKIAPLFFLFFFLDDDVALVRYKEETEAAIHEIVKVATEFGL